MYGFEQSEMYGERLVNEAIERLKNAEYVTDLDILTDEVKRWLTSSKREMMLTSQSYYENDTVEVDKKEKQRNQEWRSNSKIKHNFLKKLVDQKVGYLLDNDPTVSGDSEEQTKQFEEIYDSGMIRRIKSLAKEAVLKGVAYLQPYIDPTGQLKFEKHKSEEILPFYADRERMKVGAFAHIYDSIRYDGTERERITLVDFYTPEGVEHYIYEDNKLTLDIARGEDGVTHGYFSVEGKEKETATAHGWVDGRVPLIHVRYNEEERPLLQDVKSQIDAYNLLDSVTVDGLVDTSFLIHILKNYQAQDRAEFLKMLHQNPVVKIDGEGGYDIKNSGGEANPEPFHVELKHLRDSIYEFGRGVDTRETTLGDASGTALKFRYSDLRMDMNDVETELKSSIEYMNEFIAAHTTNLTQTETSAKGLTIIFNRSEVDAELEKVEMANESVGILDDRTIRENHPWYTPEVEKRLKEQQKEEEAFLDEQFKDLYPPQKVGEDDEQ